MLPFNGCGWGCISGSSWGKGAALRQKPWSGEGRECAIASGIGAGAAASTATIVTLVRNRLRINKLPTM
ncbi:hypothetical protein [Sphingopyxis sp. C-1]|jgi:hypothetical protein|uniref:hypothetical protein n=1 Tax=Sphingopyxis sp. C-1 TaxID=262667 RepID=UPI0006C54C29|nr:hypothetical protein [Sphingopyxis sp. C-1]GAO78572.1 hypothetical protein SC1_01881 [Sphingopyxis sp. C-1]